MKKIMHTAQPINMVNRGEDPLSGGYMYFSK